MKRTHIHGKGEKEQPDERKRTSSLPPMSEPLAPKLDALSDGKVFDYAYELLRRKELPHAEALSDVAPELCAEIRKRGLMEMLNHSLNVVSMDHAEVESEIAHVFKRQLIDSNPVEIRKLVSLIPALYTLPDFQHVKEKAQLAGIVLTDDEVKKMCWVLRGYINYMDRKDQSAP